MPPPVALLTDFGSRDPYVGMMKGVILSRAPAARIIDLCHEIPPQDVATAAFHLMTSAPYFPDDTLFVVVVDPGVGSDRRVLWARGERHQFLFPDNGVLGYLETREHLREAREVSNPELRLPKPSSTFHGRDIFSPAAGALAAGARPESLGPAAAGWKSLMLPRAERLGGRWRGRIIHIDHFGNAVTNLQAEHLRPGSRVRFGRQSLGPARRFYAEVPEGKPLALIGSSGFLELSLRGGDFARRRRARPGDPVVVD